MPVSLPCLLNLMVCLLQPQAGVPAPAAATTPRVPIQVFATGMEARPQQVRVAVYAMEQQGTLLIRRQEITRGTTGARGEPFVAAIPASTARAVVVARAMDGSDAILGSAALRYEAEDRVWVPLRALSRRLGAERAGENDPGLEPAKPQQETIAVRIPPRGAADILAVTARDVRVESDIEILVFTTAGLCIRRGVTGLYGSPYNPEAIQLLDPDFGKLVVVARDPRDPGTPQGTMLLVFDHNNWRPEVAYRVPTAESANPRAEVRWQKVVEFDAARDEFYVLPEGNAWTPEPIRLLLGDRVPGAERVMQEGRPLPPPVHKKAEGEARIVQLGHPLAPTLHWAEYGQVWVRGASASFFQMPIPAPLLQQ